MKWHELSTASDAELITWAQEQPWCQAMAECNQDARWHAEGDVWTHTQQVLHELTQLAEWTNLTDQEQTLLKFTAIFHDSAKPITTEIDTITGNITSHHHAAKGEMITRNVLRSIECDLWTREAICKLVRYHGRPVFLLSRDEPIKEIIRLSWLVNNKLLYLFALADSRGRDTEALDRPEENLHYWKEVAEEQGCYESRFPFATDHARFTFFRQAEPNLHYVPHENFACTVTVLSGLPGSGKDRWIHKHGNAQPVVALDSIREEMDVAPTDNQGEVAQIARERCRELLRNKTPFIFNATNIMRSTRGRWLDLFADYNARVEIVYIEPPLPTILRQNRDRATAIPEAVIRRLAEKCEPPTWLECHRLHMLTCATT
jgi:predicted kinase